MPSRTESFYGWHIVAVAVVANALGAGLFGLYAFVATPIVQEFGATDAQVGIGMSIAVFSMTLVNPAIGPVLDRGSIRSVMLAGVALMLASAWLLSASVALWQLGVMFGAAAIGIAMYGHLPLTVLLVNWFETRRGTALALGAAGMSLGGFCVPPLSAWLVGALGWRSAVAVVATGAAMIAFPAIAVFVVRRPEDLGQLPDGRRPDPRPLEAPATDSRDPAREPGVRDILRDRNFWVLGFGVSIAMCVPVASLFLVRHMEVLDIAPQRASVLIASISVLSLVGKLAAGLLSDRLDKRLVVVAVLLFYAVGWSLVATASSVGALVIACVPLGLGGGALLPLPAVLVGACFGRNLIGRVAGLHAPLGLPFLLVAAPLVGLARDDTGSYVAPFLGLAAVLTLAAMILSLLRIPASEPGSVRADAGMSSPVRKGA